MWDVVSGAPPWADTSRSEASANRPNGLWTAGSSEEKVVARGSDGREPFERVGACQTLARQTAPTALAPVPHLDGLVSFSLEPFELLQPLDVLGRDVTRGPAEPARVLSHDVGEDVEDLADAKGCCERMAPGSGSRLPGYLAPVAREPRRRRCSAPGSGLPTERVAAWTTPPAQTKVRGALTTWSGANGFRFFFESVGAISATSRVRVV